MVTQKDSEITAALKMNNTTNISMKSGMGKRKSAIANTDENFFRKVSKYQMDNLTVDWKEMYKERERQITHNGKERQAVMGVAKAMKV